MAKLRENKIKHKLERGEVVTVVSGSPASNVSGLIDMLGPLGFDGAWIECEHGPVDFADIPDITRACDLWDMTSIVRVNINNPGVIYRTFDVGSQGVCVPHVNTVEEARAVVDASKFHPIGSRGAYTSRQGYGVSEYISEANDETLVVVLIEDIVAIKNLTDILTVDHIDVFMVAPGDLSQSMGYPGQMTHPEVLDTVDKANEQIIRAGKVAGALANDENAEICVAKGVQFLLTAWPAWITTGASKYLEKVASASQRS